MPAPDDVPSDLLPSRGSFPDSHADKSLEAWRYQATNAQQAQLASARDNWFMKHSQRDTEILTQALQRELCSGKELSASPENVSSPKNYVNSLGHAASRNSLPGPKSNLGQTKNWQAEQGPAAFLARVMQSSSLHQHQLDNRTSFSSPASSISNSDLKDGLSQPNSPFNSSCGNSINSMVAASESLDCKPQASGEAIGFMQQQDTDELKMAAFGNTLQGPRAATTAAGAASIKLEESASLMIGSNDAGSQWARSVGERPTALSAQASAGAGATKVNKRRSRATNKPPITVLSADTANFRAMVQKLTGIPHSPSLPERNSFQLWSTPAGVPVLKPQPTRPPVQNIQGLPTLDTSFLLLEGGGGTQASRLVQGKTILQNLFAQQSTEQQMGQQAELACGDLRALWEQAKVRGGSSSSNGCISMPMLWEAGEREKMMGSNEEGVKQRGESLLQTMVEANQLTMPYQRSVPNFDSNSFIDFEYLGSRAAPPSIDSWLSFDGGLSSLTPKIQLAHSA